MKKLDSTRYPIGQHEYGKTYSLDETRKNIKTIARLPKDLKKALRKLSNSDLDKSYRQDGWTVRQLVHHLADSHINAYIRMKMAVTEQTPVIKTYEEALWAETEDGKKAPVKVSLKLLSALHRRWTIFLESLTEEDLERGYFHPEMRRIITLPDALAAYSLHCRHHLAHINMVMEGAHFESEAPKKSYATDKKAEAKSQVNGTIAPSKADEPKKRGPKPKAQAAASAEAKPKAKRGMSPEHMAKIREARMAKRAAAATTASAATTAEPKKRGPKPKIQPVAAEAKPAAKRGPKPKDQPAAAEAKPAAKRGPKPKAQAAAAEAKPAAKRGPKPKAQAAAAEVKPAAKRGPKPKAQAAASEAKPAAKRGPKPKAQAVAAEEKPAAKRGPKPKAQAAAAEEKPAAKRGPKPKAQSAATAEAKPKGKRGMSPEHMAKIRDARMAKRAAAALAAPEQTPVEPKKGGPKAMTQTVVAKPKTQPVASADGQAPKKRGMSPEHMAKIRDARMAKLAEKKANK